MHNLYECKWWPLNISQITTAEHPEECERAGFLNTWFESEFGASVLDAPRAAGQSPCFDQEPWGDWEERRRHDTCWLVRKIKAFKKMTAGLEYVLSFPFISERVESSLANFNFKKSAWSQNYEKYSLRARFWSTTVWPFIVITIITSSNKSSNCWEVKDSFKRQTQRNVVPVFAALTSVKSLQLLEIKFQTGSFIPRCVQLILQLGFKEAAVVLCGAAPRRPGLQLAAAAKPITSPPTGHTSHTGQPPSRNYYS